jgi:hypothetical protein
MEKDELNSLQSLAYISIVMIVFGNTLNYSNFLLSLLYKPIEKLFFYKPVRKFYKRYTKRDVTIEENEYLIK